MTFDTESKVPLIIQNNKSPSTGTCQLKDKKLQRCAISSALQCLDNVQNICGKSNNTILFPLLTPHTFLEGKMNIALYPSKCQYVPPTCIYYLHHCNFKNEDRVIPQV